MIRQAAIAIPIGPTVTVQRGIACDESLPVPGGANDASTGGKMDAIRDDLIVASIDRGASVVFALEDGSWWFADEENVEYGPFDTRPEAREALLEYLREWFM